MVYYLPNHSSGVGILGYPHGRAFPPTMDLNDKVIPPTGETGIWITRSANVPDTIPWVTQDSYRVLAHNTHLFHL